MTRIVYGAECHQVHRMYSGDRYFDTMGFIRDAFRDDIRIEGRVSDAEGVAVYYGPDDDPPREAQGNLQAACSRPLAQAGRSSMVHDRA